ncbi:MAG: hypothetical protein KGK10_00465 [Rhodospirillales bacterium]|nr:hypothetical protein [Rhodospirillales bacterium]
MNQDMKKRAEALADRLRTEGKAEHAGRLVAALHSLERGAENAVLATLLGVVDVVLDAAEAIDPGTQAMAEELRTLVEAHLRTPTRLPPKQG